MLAGILLGKFKNVFIYVIPALIIVMIIYLSIHSYNSLTRKNLELELEKQKLEQELENANTQLELNKDIQKEFTKYKMESARIQKEYSDLKKAIGENRNEKIQETVGPLGDALRFISMFCKDPNTNTNTK